MTARERPILFNGEMVKAILEGRKTQTRRTIKGQDETFLDQFIGEGTASGDEQSEFSQQPEGEGVRIWLTDYPEEGSEIIKCPYGQPGDRLWVRETWCPLDNREFGGKEWIDYRATPSDHASHPGGWHNEPTDPDAAKWRPSIHMPRWASRINLEIVNVRVERLQDISEEDAKAEGCIFTFCQNKIGVFKVLWESINGPGSWDSNPWVWVIEFRKV